MVEIITAVVCNLIAVLILVCGIMSAINGGWRVALARLVLTSIGLVGTYFALPHAIEFALGIEEINAFVTEMAFGVATINSCVFTVLFLAISIVIGMICSIIKIWKTARNLQTE